MKTSTALIALAGVLFSNLQGAIAGCYTTGETWPDGDQQRQAVMDACYDNVFSNGALAGFYGPGETKRACVPSDNYPGMGFVYEVQNLNGQEGFAIADVDCYIGVKNEVLGCSKGGESTTESLWRFRADPGFNTC
ncbi:hypothetical protein LTR56_012863 [Elasticomyces elasticus]|nr:hypothetical protein LTR56_012863 [Elasticomyces elasticus]KAK3650789.1 hypothetical protein LTR22_012388 [Elasticomyces elasticus]KAK4918493.1 hypothetical protein LTR49_013726 [Elasticomyces elasticus]KAK5757869.1 hypothetical protein LTS12_012053 [Elasticomyces elasticus]